MEVLIRPSDTFRYFSQLFDIPLLLIEKSNPQADSELLTAGQRVQIPGYMIKNYTITVNDTLWNIASKHNIAFDMLRLTNQSIDAANVQIDQTISVPERVHDLLISDFDHYTFNKMETHIDNLIKIYPFVSGQSIGNSVMGKDLIELQIGSGNKQVHLNGSFHANEWITTSTIMRFVNEYVLSITNNQPIRGLNMLPLFSETLLSVVPMVNPDGVNLVLNGASAAGVYRDEILAINDQNHDFTSWKANIRGVDLNKQFPARWHIEAERKPNSPQPRDHPGSHPLSEPESMAMTRLARDRNFARLNSFHTQGEEIYWGFEGLESSVSEAIVNEYSRASGYQPIRYIDNYAGYKDWYIQDFRQPGFTIELGTGINPLPFAQFEKIYQDSLGIMLANLYF